MICGATLSIGGWNGSSGGWAPARRGTNEIRTGHRLREHFGGSGGAGIQRLGDGSAVTLNAAPDCLGKLLSIRRVQGVARFVRIGEKAEFAKHAGNGGAAQTRSSRGAGCRDSQSAPRRRRCGECWSPAGRIAAEVVGLDPTRAGASGGVEVDGDELRAAVRVRDRGARAQAE